MAETSPTAVSIAEDGSGKPSLLRGLSLLDATLFIVSGIIGSSIFLTAKDIAGPLPHPTLFLGVWVLGGLISMCAALAFAEMASMFPESGGQYVFLREAYGDYAGFLYGWMYLTVSSGGSIAALAVASGAYAGKILPMFAQENILFTVAGMPINATQAYAIAAIAFLTWVNVTGVREGAMMQNIATWARTIAMVAFIILGLTVGRGAWANFHAAASGVTSLSMGYSPGQFVGAIGIALIAVFWAYDGWVYSTFVAGEVKNAQRNVPISIVLGLLIVGVLYVAMNVVYVYAMPTSAIAKEEAVAFASATSLFSPSAAVWLSATIAIACFGAAASCALGGGRIFYAMAKDGVFFPQMAAVHPRFRTPAIALIVQGVWSAILTLSGRYDQLYTYVIFMMVLFYVMTVVGLFILRWKRPDAPRPYRCTGYPWLPAIYLLVAGAWTLNTLIERPKESLIGVAIVLAGTPIYWYYKRKAA